MAPSSGTMNLGQRSAAYRGYLALGRLPRNTPSFSLNSEGCPVVHRGEVCCRMPQSEGGSCGRRFAHRQSLGRHVRVVHRTFEAKGFNRTTVQEADAFYIDLMKEEEYEGKHSNAQYDAFGASPRDWALNANQRNHNISRATVEMAITRQGAEVGATQNTRHAAISVAEHVTQAPSIANSQVIDLDPSDDEASSEEITMDSMPQSTHSGIKMIQSAEMNQLMQSYAGSIARGLVSVTAAAPAQQPQHATPTTRQRHIDIEDESGDNIATESVCGRAPTGLQHQHASGGC
ncbi:uncharacterized protein RCC_01793 [Lecanosticta acicola]|uniref:Uncharacterized protein RCC_01793 n=1 Tax=Lecanosticta acicola TaxID=111012 RepID=A0AAI8YSL9_9PEZI|nr:uncharacterized protein RCC_01793 [Lecanosticta acicola]